MSTRELVWAALVGVLALGAGTSLSTGALTATSVIALERVLRAVVAPSAAMAAATLVLLASSVWRNVVLAGDPVRGFTLLLGVLALALAWHLSPRPRARFESIAGFSFSLLAAMFWALMAPASGPLLPFGESLLLLPALFASGDGWLHRSPVFWLALPGLFLLARRRRRAALLIALVLACVVLMSDVLRLRPLGEVAFEPLLPAMALPLAVALSRLRAWVRRRPSLPLLAAGAALVVWNFLFMEQYRTLLPKDETVSFARVSGTNAALFAAKAGAPLAWPANWIFALRQGVAPDRYDGLVGRTFFGPGASTAILVLAEPGHPALVGGWSEPVACGAARCREIEGRARLLLPPEGRLAQLTLAAQGTGTLAVEANGIRIGELPLPETLAEQTLAVPAGAWGSGFNELALSASGGTRVERIVLRRR